LYTLRASGKVGKAGKVFSFEPGEKSFHSLQNHLRINNIQNVTAEKLAVSDRDAMLTLHHDETECDRGTATLYPGKSTATEKVKAIRLDEYFSTMQENIRLIKMDIEGGEYAALKGMENLLRRLHPAILMEIDEENLQRTPYSAKDLEDFLSSIGYEKWYIDHRGDVTKTEVQSGNTNTLWLQKIN
jgi:FkbM family methyltransferase